MVRVRAQIGGGVDMEARARAMIAQIDCALAEITGTE